MTVRTKTLILGCGETESVHLEDNDRGLGKSSHKGNRAWPRPRGVVTTTKQGSVLLSLPLEVTGELHKALSCDCVENGEQTYAKKCGRRCGRSGRRRCGRSGRKRWRPFATKDSNQSLQLIHQLCVSQKQNAGLFDERQMPLKSRDPFLS